MKCTGRFVFKTLEKKAGGEFINSNGEKVNYDGSYQIKVDEILDTSINERKFKFPLSSKDLFEKFNTIKPYETIEVDFALNFYASNVRVVPLDVRVQTNK